MSAILDQPGGAQFAEARPRDGVPTARWIARAGTALLCVLPALLTLYLSFNSGGYYAASQGLVVAVLAAVLLVRVIAAPDPFGGFTRTGVIAVGALAAYAIWSLISAHWSHAPARALLGYNLAALYALVLAIFGSTARSHRRVRWTMGLTWAAMLAVCLASLATRLRPDLFPIPQAISPNRLAYPLTYWNALGLFATVGLILSLHLASSRQNSGLLRVLASAVSPIFAVTMLLTFSRATLVLGAAGIVLYAVLARPRGLIGALLATGPASAVALLDSFHAKFIDNADQSAAAVAQGHHLVTVIALTCLVAGSARAVLLPLDERLADVHVPAPPARATRLGAVLAVVAIALIAVVGFGGQIERQWQNFVKSDSAAGINDVRNRIDAIHVGSRLRVWKVTLDVFQQHPLTGSGANTFANEWYRQRSTGSTALQAHSLYLQALSELGLPGAIAIVVGLLCVLGACLRRRGRSRSLWSAVFVITLLWVLHAGVDWDWQMPALTLPVLALAAAGLARRGAGRPIREGRELALRIAVGAAAIAIGFAGFNIATSGAHLASSVTAYNLRDCGRASTEARASIAAVSSRPEAYTVIGYCDILSGAPGQAVAQMRSAIAQDPGAWDYRYGLAVALAASGRDAMPALEAADRLDPLESLIATAQTALAGKHGTELKAAAFSLAMPVELRS